MSYGVHHIQDDQELCAVRPFLPKKCQLPSSTWHDPAIINSDDALLSLSLQFKPGTQAHGSTGPTARDSSNETHYGSDTAFDQIEI